MYSLFLRLFEKRYWRMLLRKATWFEARMNLRRVHKDKRARKHILGVALALLIPIIAIGYLAWFAWSGAIFLLPFLIPVVWWRRRSAARDCVPLRISPAPEPCRSETSDEECRKLRAFFADLALFYAAMIDRAGSEVFLKEKILPDGFEVVSRRLHIDLLRTKNIWNRSALKDREMMMMPDGHWEWPQINQVIRSMEPLRLLRWILRIDFYLPTVGQQLQNDYRSAHELVNSPQKLRDSKEMIDVSTARIGRDSAQQFFVRCWAEAISRGYYEADDEQTAITARDISAELGGKQHEDLVLNDKLVSEVTKEDLLWATSLSWTRVQFLTWAISMLEGAAHPEFSSSIFIA